MTSQRQSCFFSLLCDLCFYRVFGYFIRNSTLLSAIMVHCCVPACTNHSSITKGISYHKIPKDKQLRKSWISRLRRDNLPPVDNCYVCSDHFEKECFESDLIEELTGEKKKKRLKSDAVPSIFNFPTSIPVVSTSRTSSENRNKRRRRQEVSLEFLTFK